MTPFEKQCVAGVAELLDAYPAVRGVLLPVGLIVEAAGWSA